MSQQLLIRVSEEDRALLDAICELDGISRSEMIRRLIRSAAQGRSHDMTEVLKRWYTKAVEVIKAEDRV